MFHAIFTRRTPKWRKLKLKEQIFATEQTLFSVSSLVVMSVWRQKPSDLYNFYIFIFYFYVFNVYLTLTPQSPIGEAP